MGERGDDVFGQAIREILLLEISANVGEGKHGDGGRVTEWRRHFRLRRVTRPGSLVVVLSDFRGLSRAAQSYLSSVARHNELEAAEDGAVVDASGLTLSIPAP